MSVREARFVTFARTARTSTRADLIGLWYCQAAKSWIFFCKDEELLSRFYPLGGRPGIFKVVKEKTSPSVEIRFQITFSSYHRKGSITLSLAEKKAIILLGKHVVDFAGSPECRGGVNRNLTQRIVLTEALGDIRDYSSCPKNTSWVIEKFWWQPAGQSGGDGSQCFTDLK